MRVSHDVSTNVALFSFSFLRMSVSFIFSPDSHQVFACFLKTVTQLSYFIRTSVTKISYCKFAKILWQQVRDTCTNVVRRSHNSLAKYFGEKIGIKFLNLFKTFMTISLHIKILTTLARHWHERRAKVCD